MRTLRVQAKPVDALRRWAMVATSVLVLAAAWPATVRAQSVQLPDFTDLVERVGPAVVNIRTLERGRSVAGGALDPGVEEFFRRFGIPLPGGRADPRGGPRADDAPPQQRGVGSGFILSADGYIMTNAHVVDGADEIDVTLSDGRKARATVIGTDPETDLAILKIELDKLPVIVLGDSDTALVGDRVLAIGNPFGVGQTVTSGIVSALGRSQLGINTFENFIQTDAAINPGNSGGALVDVNGNLLGINTAIYSRSGGSLGIGFAIPVSTAKMVLSSITTTGQVTRGWIGVEPSELSPEMAETFGVKATSGVLITGVLQNAPGAQAGLRPGDVITQVAGKPVVSVSGLLSAVAALTPGETAGLRVQRGDQEVALEVTPGVRPKQRRAPVQR